MTKHVMNRWSDEEIDAKADSGPVARGRVGAIDVHTHYLPQVYRDAFKAVGMQNPDGYHVGVPDWSVESQLANMERLGIETAVMSISSPGILIPGSDVPRLAREINEVGAQVARDHPGRLGFYAVLPLPDVDAALEEIAYAYDELGAWGVSLLTHTQGVYLGDEKLRPIFEELGRRGAVTLVHPTAPAALVPNVMEGWSRSMFEYFADTTRAVINLVFSGQLRDNPGVRMLLPHAGSSLPMLAQRLERNIWRANSEAGFEQYPSMIDTLKGCWFDLAGSSLPYQIHTMRAFADPKKIVWGSDFPFTSGPMAAELAADQRTTDQTTEAEKVAYLRDNALALFADKIDGGIK